MTTVNIYLTFNGNCEDAFNFYSSMFGKDFESMSRYSDMPSQDGMPPIPDEHRNRIMHVALPISDETVLMGSDTGGAWAGDYKAGNNFSISISTDTMAEADRIFAELSAGGKVTMPLNKTFWGSYFGMVNDQFGIQWMVNHNLPSHK